MHIHECTYIHTYMSAQNTYIYGCTHKCTQMHTRQHTDVYLSSSKLFSDETALGSKALYQVILTWSFRYVTVLHQAFINAFEIEGMTSN